MRKFHQTVIRAVERELGIRGRLVEEPRSGHVWMDFEGYRTKVSGTPSNPDGAVKDVVAEVRRAKGMGSQGSPAMHQKPRREKRKKPKRSERGVPTAISLQMRDLISAGGQKPMVPGPIMPEPEVVRVLLASDPDRLLTIGGDIDDIVVQCPVGWRVRLSIAWQVLTGKVLAVIRKEAKSEEAAPDTG